jgi:hypothetical protein
VRKSWDSNANLDLNDQPPSGRPASATHNLNRQKVDELIQENRRISQRAIAEKLNIGLTSVNDIITLLQFGLQKSVCSMDAASAHA